METYRDLAGAVGRRQAQMRKMIAELVGVESPTEDRAAVNRCVASRRGWPRRSARCTRPAWSTGISSPRTS